MTTVSRYYQLTQPQKEIIAGFLHGEIPSGEAAAEFKQTRAVFKAMVASMVQQMVTGGSLDITEALNSY